MTVWPASASHTPGLVTAPPPSDTTPSCSANAARTTPSSMRRNSCSPSVAKMSAMVRPACCSIATAVSSKLTPSALASRRPMGDLPEPGKPTSTALGVMCACPLLTRGPRGRRFTLGDRTRLPLDVAGGLVRRIAAELLQYRAGQNQRHHGFDHDSGGRHRADVRALVDSDGLVTGCHVDGGQRPRHGGDRLHGGAHPQRLAVGHAPFEPTCPVGRADDAVRPGVHLVVGTAAAPTRGLETVADLHSLDRLYAHDGSGQLAVEPVVAAGERSQSDR